MSYEKISKLGKGAYGIVYSAKNQEKKDVVVKRILFDKKNTDAVKGLLGVREVDYAKSLEHPYVLTAIELLHEKPFTKLSPRRGLRDDKVYLVFPKAKYSMDELIYKCETPISHIKRAMYQTLVGLDYLHSQGLCHRDIKPDNILCFYDDGVLTTKFCDFGMSKPILPIEKNSTHVVTSVYRPPEILLGCPYYDFSIDIWALGVCFYEMVTKQDLFPDCSSISHLNHIFKLLGTPSSSFFDKYGSGESPKFKNYEGTGLESKMKDIPADFETPEVDCLPNPGTWLQFIDLLKHMIVIEPAKRYTPFQCLQHPFFSGFYDNTIENFGLVIHKQPYKKVEWKPLEIKNKNKVLELFKPFFDEIKEEHHRILFMALDMFMRLIDKITDNQEEICRVCIYLSFKYFMDVQSPEWKDVFNTKPKNNLTKMENFIVKDLLNYKIFRPLLWDIVYTKNSNIDSIKLLEFIVSGNNDYQTLIN